MGTKLARAPVYFAIMQVRFNQITALHRYIPDIQDRLRRLGYPDFASGQKTQLTLPILPQSHEAVGETTLADMPSLETGAYFLFGRADRTTNFLLHQNSLTLQITRYDRFETAFEQMRDAMAAVHDILDLSFIDQVGFRYLNAIIPDSDSELDAYVHPSIMGLSGPFDTLQVMSESVFQFDPVKVLARSVVRHSALGFPDDVFPLNLEFDSRFTGWEAPHAILDIDGFITGRLDYSAEAIADRFRLVHEALARVFQAYVTPEALAAWSRNADAGTVKDY